MEKILFISPSTFDKKNMFILVICGIPVLWCGYRVFAADNINIILFGITLIFLGFFVLLIITTPYKFILTNSHFIIKRHLKDSVIPLQNIKTIRHITHQEWARHYGTTALRGMPFGHYPSKLKGLIGYIHRWNNWTILITDRGKFLISPNDLQLIAATLQQIDKVKVDGVNGQVAKTPSNRWRKQFPAAIIIAVSLVVYFSYKEPKFVSDVNAFKMKGMYGVNIPFAEISEADTIGWHLVPARSIRTNGISLFKVHRGYFRTMNGNKIKLSVRSGVSPVIRITDSDGMVHYINRKNPDETRHIFSSLQANLQTHNK